MADLTNEIQEKLLDFITRNFVIERDEFNLNESLIDQGVIDSLGLIEINSYIENEYSLSITDNQMNRDNFGSVIKIVNFIIRLLEEHTL